MTGSIHKKGKVYYIVFRIFDSESGKRKLKWIPAGNSKRAAERHMNDLMGDVHNGTFRELKKATFSQFADLWLESYAKLKTKPSTFRSYHDIIHKHLIPVMGDYLLTEITTGKLQRYVALRLAKVKPKTVINEIVPIKELFKHAVRWGYLRVNPAEYLERPRSHRKEIDILTLKLANEMRHWKTICPKNDHGLVFPSPEGKMSIHENVVKRYFNPALKSAGLRRVSFHSLRHTNASLRIEAGQNIKYIQNQLGHASIQTTLDRYGHLIREVNTEQVRRFENVLGYAEHSDSFSDSKNKSVRRMLEDSDKNETEGLVIPLPVRHLEAIANA